VGLPADLERERYPWRVLALLVGGLAALLALAYLFARRAAQPLKALANAANAIGQGRPVAPVPETGPAEVVAVARGFNQMRDDLAQLENERALMLAGVSHDIRTPLTRLKLELEMSQLDATAKESLMLDLDEIERTVGQFVEFARTTVDVPKAPLDVTAWLSELTAREQLRRGSAVSLRVQPLPKVLAHAQSVDRAVANLIDNAFRYGSDTVEVSAQLQDAHTIAIAVDDRGPGIAPEEAQRLLRPFTRGNDARSDTGGTGLGLAIVARIAQWHGGELTLLPREGGGTRAQLTLAIGTTGVEVSAQPQ
jgi:two-component system osmolarity sensor histidine kinase EnvZ